MQGNYTFYAFNVNGHTVAIYNTPAEALDELEYRLKECDTDEYSIEPIDGIWRMLERMGDFDDRYDDDWMEEVVMTASRLIMEKNEKPDSKKTSPEKQTAT
ncbi:hypothetical protein IKD67_02050 [Candidatus Saccharibacteria bacterium]|nr:hypothetical protein [Candidatus Saccharibacteria bacterium]